MTASSFFLVRHGESENNRLKLMAGWIDTPLSERGRSQAQELCAAARGGLSPQPDVMVCSALSRARDTALALNAALNLPMREDSGFNERNFGAWGGQTVLGKFERLSNGETPPEGESMADFSARIFATLKVVLAQTNRPLIVAHGGVFDALAYRYGRRSVDVENCHMYRFDSVNDPDCPWRIWHYQQRPTGLVPVEAPIFQP